MARTSRPAPVDEAADRVSAYVYGNVLLLAALVVLSREDARDGAGLAIVAGTAVSTFVAHTYAERLGAAVRSVEHASWSVVLRDSVPILSAAAVPAALMGAAALDVLPATASLRLAETWVVVRIALTAFIVGRLQGRPVTLRTWVASVGLAATALVVVAVKVVLTH
jgi:hypothetical protein